MLRITQQEGVFSRSAKSVGHSWVPPLEIYSPQKTSDFIIRSELTRKYKKD